LFLAAPTHSQNGRREKFSFAFFLCCKKKKNFAQIFTLKTPRKSPKFNALQSNSMAARLMVLSEGIYHFLIHNFHTKILREKLFHVHFKDFPYNIDVTWRFECWRLCLGTAVASNGPFQRDTRFQAASWKLRHTIEIVLVFHFAQREQAKGEKGEACDTESCGRNSSRAWRRISPPQTSIS